VTGAITIIASESLAALIFTGNPSSHLADGVDIALVTAALTGLIVSLTGSSGVAIAIPQDGGGHCGGGTVRRLERSALLERCPRYRFDDCHRPVLSCSDWDRPEEHLMRIRRTGSGTLVGEVSFYLGTRRTALVITNDLCKAYSLTAAALKRMEAERLELAAALHRFIADLLAERLLRTTQTLEAVLD
jgi:CRP-like cAMP-binding protein